MVCQSTDRLNVRYVGPSVMRSFGAWLESRSLSRGDEVSLNIGDILCLCSRSEVADSRSLVKVSHRSSFTGQ